MGSASGDLATIDLKGASDSISLALVEALVPSDVLPHLLSLRSPHGVVDGERVTYEKISSMGNGFTFELETAIFYCLVRAASGHAMAYGDDLICHAHSYSFVCDVLAFCGFEVNAKKSFYRGPFRESCGGHYFKGVDVTPPYVRKPLVGPTRITVANRVSELSDNGYWRRSHLFRFHRELVRGIPRALWGPRDVPGVVHCGLYDAHPSYSKRYQSFTGTRVVEAPRRRDADPYGALLQSLWSHGDEDSWRETAFMKAPFRPVISFKRWWSHWPGVSPWAAEDC
jgi:hypothetical protein